MTWQAGRRGGALAEGDDDGIDASECDVDGPDDLAAEDVEVEPVDQPPEDEGDHRWGGWATDASI